MDFVVAVFFVLFVLWGVSPVCGEGGGGDCGVDGVGSWRGRKTERKKDDLITLGI